MFKLQRLRRRLTRLESRHRSEINKFLKTPDKAELKDALAAQGREIDSVLFEIEQYQSLHLISKAELLDIDEPDSDDTQMWYQDAYWDRILSPAGRAYLRKLIDEEEVRRRDVQAWWWRNVVIPAITALTGLVGVITGMIAVIHSKK